MNLLELGKLLETIGAIGLAYVGVRAAALEMHVGRHLHEDRQNAAGSTLDQLRARLDEARRFRQRQFGLIEAVIVGAGTSLIAVGCVLYLYDLLAHPH